MKAKLLLIAAMIASTAWAVKMQPGLQTIRQADGTTLTVRGMGDEDFHYLMTSDGALLYQQADSFFVAKINADGTLESTGVLAHDEALRTDAERSLIAAQDLALFNANIESNSQKGRKQREALILDSSFLPSKGSPRVPVIVVDFSDTPFTVADPCASFDKYLNAEELFTLETDPDMSGNYGSVRRYFSDMSFGQFTPQFDVYGPVTLPNTLAYYGAGNSSRENMRELFLHACRAVDDEVDFSQYDSNGDGLIDLVYIIYAGFPQCISGNSTDCIYPKSGYLSLGETFDGVSVRRYGVNSELNYNPEISAANGYFLNGIGLFCHELSHCMGLPDFYVTKTTTALYCIDQGLDYWSLMDSGEYSRDGFQPTAFTAWERESLGWITIDTLDQPQLVTLTPVSDGGKAYRILNDNDPTGHEYYIVENIQRSGWNSVSLGHGMIVFHVDYDETAFSVTSNSVNNVAEHPRMTIVAADGMFVPEYYKGRQITVPTDTTLLRINKPLIDKYGGQTITSQMYRAECAGDPYPGTSAVTELTDTSTPHAKVYTQQPLGKPITDITEDEATGTVSFCFMGYVPSGISSTPAVSVDNEQIYSLDGRRLGTDFDRLAKGIYIVGGRKVVK